LDRQNDNYCEPVGWDVQYVDSVVQIVRRGLGALTPVSLRGKTERMIEIVTGGGVVVVLTKRVAP
jgi:hypothetical protein